MRRAAILCVLLACAGCAHSAGMRAKNSPPRQPDVELASHAEEAELLPIYIISNGFHTGIILRTDDVSRKIWPEVDAIPEHPYVEVGWGSEKFYRARQITPGIVLGAAFPNASVLHVVGWDRNPEELFSSGDMIRLEIDQDQFNALTQHIHDSYERDRYEVIDNLGPGIYGDGFFFRAKGKYFFPNTCNVWTARGLKKAGIPIIPETCSLADSVLSSARKVGTTIRRR